MQVVTLTPEAFDGKCAELGRTVKTHHPGAFDATVAIRTGGSRVCDSMAGVLSEDYLGERHEVSIRRPSTKKKDGFIGRILPLFPRPLLDMMRIAEAWTLNLQNRLHKPDQSADATLGNGLAAILSDRNTPEILIIDDAVDSGRTLAAVVRSILKANPNAKLTSAVITVTTSRPEVKPDFSLYSNHTLIRFPWSKDFPR